MRIRTIKNKRGIWLGEETGKTILAVISIIILLFIGYNLYKILVPSKEESQARSILNNVESNIKELSETNASSKMTLAGSVDWFLFTENDRKSVCVCRGEKECDVSKKFCRLIGNETKTIKIDDKISVFLTDIKLEYKKQDGAEIVEIKISE